MAWGTLPGRRRAGVGGSDLIDRPAQVVAELDSMKSGFSSAGPVRARWTAAAVAWAPWILGWFRHPMPRYAEHHPDRQPRAEE